MGEVIAYLYSVEFQKRSLPHAHILIWLLDGQSIRSNRVDELICAEIPDIDADPELFAILTANMVHGHSPACQTTGVSRCSKGFPKADRMDDPLYIGQRTILCTTNVHVDSINDLMINRCRGISKTYLSVDTVRNSDYELTYSTEFLNSLNISGMPPHKLTFKVGTSVIFIRSTEAPITVN